jgi:hypothetical protein
MSGKATDWRNLPGWRVLGSDGRPRAQEKPDPRAERGGDGYWASLYDEDGRTILKTWVLLPKGLPPKRTP